MKKIIIAPVVPLLFCFSIILLSACKKSSDTVARFTWTYGDTVHTAVLHKAFIASMASGPIVMASKTNSIRPASGNHLSIMLSSFAVGTYSFSSAGGTNYLYYVDSAGDDVQALSGTVTITSYANNLLSGSFSFTARHWSGTTRPLTGSFSNTPVEQ